MNNMTHDQNTTLLNLLYTINTSYLQAAQQLQGGLNFHKFQDFNDQSPTSNDNKETASLNEEEGCLIGKKTKKSKSKNFICGFENCGKRFEYKWILERHTNSHFCFKLFKCEYEDCDKAYKSKENLNLHIKNKHLNMKPYQCSFCQLLFSHRNGKYCYEVKII
jgi:hypothetical protein